MAGVIVIRDAGGLGDLVRIFAVVDGLGESTLILPDTYAGLARCCRAVAEGRCRAIPLLMPPRRRRSPRGRLYERWGDVQEAYLLNAGDLGAESRVVDLFCPALMHEVDTGAKPTMDRMECWARRAEIWPMKYPCVELAIPGDAETRAEAWWSAGHLRPARTIAVSAASVRGIRTWRNATRHGASRAGRVGGLLAMLRSMGWRTLVLDHAEGARSLPADAVSIDPDHATQMAIMRRCAGYIGPDSGFLHAAAGLGMRCVGLFGPTDGRLVMAPYDHRRVLILQGEHGATSLRSWGCSRPCYGMTAGSYRPERCGGRCGVLESITERQIAEAADRFLRAPRETHSPQVVPVEHLGLPDHHRVGRGLHHQ